MFHDFQSCAEMEAWKLRIRTEFVAQKPLGYGFLPGKFGTVSIVLFWELRRFISSVEPFPA